MITIPTEDSNYMHFCGQFCLSVFRHKKKQVEKTPDKWTDKQQERKPEKQSEKTAERQPERPTCSVCKVSNRVRDNKILLWHCRQGKGFFLVFSRSPLSLNHILLAGKSVNFKAVTVRITYPFFKISNFCIQIMHNFIIIHSLCYS